MDDQLKPAQNNEVSTLSIKDLFYKYVRFLPLFIISIALSLFVAYVYLRYATLVYTSTGAVVVENESASAGGNDKLDALFQGDNKKNIQNEIEYLQSRQLMSRVVKALNLNFTYLAKGNIKELNIYKATPFVVESFEIADSSGFVLNIEFESSNLFKVNNSAQAFTFGQVFKNEMGVFRLVRNPKFDINKDYKVSWAPTNDVANGLVSSLSVTPKQNTGILLLKLESTNPQLAADVVNQLMEEYQNATIGDKNAETQNRMVFIEKELQREGRELDSITNLRLNFLKENGLYSVEAQSEMLIKQVEESDKERQLQGMQLSKAFQIEDHLNSSRGAPVPSSLNLEDPTLNEMIGAYNQAQLERIALLEHAPEGNVVVKRKQEVIDQLKQKILVNLANVKRSYQNTIGTLQGISNTAQSKVKLMPEQQQALVAIQRQLEGKEEIFKNLLVKREEAAIQLAATISDIKVLEEATPNNSPIKPNRRNTQLLAALVGLLLPALFIFVLEILNDKVTTRHDVERLTSAPVLGEVGHSYNKNTLVVTNNNRSVIAEQFRIIRSNLQYVLNNLQNPVILVTSSFSGEGKSFVSTNVGAVMALAGKRTIILEFDIRKPKILSQLHIPKRAGLTNYLLGKTKLEDLPVPVEENENLFVLACGPVPPNPSELLLDQKLNELFVWLRQNFDVVIMDTAPVGMVSDAMTLSRFANSTLYIVRQGHTFKKQIALIDEFHQDGKLPKISIVLNDVKIRSGYGYYGYGRYGYGYGYGGGGYYEDEAPPPTMLQKWFGWLDTHKWKKKKSKRTKA